MDAPAPRGGRAQRKRKRSAVADADCGKSQLVAFLIQQWAWGEISAQMVQKIASRAHADITCVREGTPIDLDPLATLSSLGGHGTYPNHCSGELHNKISGVHLSPLTLSKIWTTNVNGLHPTQREQPLILPHVLFADMYNKYPAAFAKRVCPSRERLLEFWDAMADNPQLMEHPVTTRPNYKTRAVPISLHGDAVPVTGVGKAWSRSLDLFSWCSLLGVGLTMEFNFFIWGIFKTIVSEKFMRNTKHNFWTILIWSLRALYEGVWPTERWDGAPWENSVDINRAGTPLAGSPHNCFYCVLWCIKGDLVYYRDELKLPSYNAVHGCCFCPCTTAANHRLNANEFRRAYAHWIDATYTTEDWLTNPYNDHPIFQLPGVSILTVAADLMHVKHMGTDMYFYGSVLSCLVYYMMPGRPEENLQMLWEEIKQFQKLVQTPTRYTNLRLSMFSIAEFEEKMPLLKGRAKEVCCMGPALAHIWEQHPGETEVAARLGLHGEGLQYKQIQLALDNCNTIETILEENRHEIKLPPSEHTKFCDNGFNFLVLYNAVAVHYTRIGYKLFNVVSKCHYFAHALLKAKYLNPRLGWCYGGEDFMFHTKKLMAACCRGNKPWQAVAKFAKHYRIALHLSFEKC